ncbi:MAG: hypothetical protein MUD02_07855 [Bacteroidales bacterium]|jgi:hypothetical protein|nr:hypothetical protein [Bacteroidales bacterium]MCU0408846.1 hypothetical protein [Bacteroidales bacterium]
MIKVLGIKIIDRIKEAGRTQEVLSRHASLITTRLGFHEVTDSVCSREAYIILHLNGNPDEAERLESGLKQVGGIELREMIFTEKEKASDVSLPEGSTEIIGILVERNQAIIAEVQKLLTLFGCNIRTRLGLNETFFGEPAGLIILELKGDALQRALLEKELRAIGQVHVRTMVFAV